MFSNDWFLGFCGGFGGAAVFAIADLVIFRRKVEKDIKEVNMAFEISRKLSRESLFLGAAHMGMYYLEQPQVLHLGGNCTDHNSSVIARSNCTVCKKKVIEEARYVAEKVSGRSQDGYTI